MTYRLLAFVLSVSLVGILTGCGDGALSVDYPEVTPGNLQTHASALSQAQRRERARAIRDTSASMGLNNGVLLAGIANAETNLAHCWSEATWACKGPNSSSCGGGPVIAGSADGPCSARQGGLGMYQFDGGTYDQTLAREGQRVLSLQGNIEAAVDFVLYRVQISDFIHGVSNRAEALAWMNSVRVGTPQYERWIRTVTGYYNGCFEGKCSVFWDRYQNYDNKTRAMLSDFGHDFWYGDNTGGSTGSSPPSGGSSSQPSGGSTGGSSSQPSGSGSSPQASAPDRPADLRASSTSIALDDSIEFSWRGANGADSYVLSVDYQSNGMWQHYYTWHPSQTSFEMWPQVDDTDYRWFVRACNATGCSDRVSGGAFSYGAGSASNNSGSSSSSSKADEPGPSSSSTAASGAPQKPSGLQPAGVGINTPSVPLHWNPTSGATSYDILMYWHDGTDWVEYYVWEDKSSSSFTVWPVVDDTYYAWAVRACDGADCSKWTDFQQFYFTGK